MAQEEKILNDKELNAIALVTNEITQWETATAFITEKVAFQMRDLIRQLRKNYWGVFDTPNDPNTGRKKIWIPLTESWVEAAVKNIDLDTKDINFRAKVPTSIGLVPIIRHAVQDNLDDIYFGEHLDELARNIAIDGTAVWKTIERKDENGRAIFDIRTVDLLNVYIDPTARSIQEAYRFTERSLMSTEEIKQMKGWQNTEGLLQTKKGLSPNDTYRSTGNSTSNAKFRDVWESWGQFPKWWFTNSEEDQASGEEVEAQIVVSGIEAGNPRVHIMKQNNKVRPYEEAWYSRVSGRWYGRGVAEKVIMLQLWMNTIVNIRINRSYVSQLGIFKMKKGSGVTAQMLSRLVANGVVMVNNMDDLEQLVVDEASSASYQDEDRIKDWTQRVTSAFETVTGEKLPAETTATAVAIQGQGAQSAFVLIKEGMGNFLRRWLKRHALPIITKNLRSGDIVRITGDPEMLRSWDETLVNHAVMKELNKREGTLIDPEQVLQMRQQMLATMRARGSDRFIEMQKDIDFSTFDILVTITNEVVDQSIVAQNLVTMLQAAPNFSEALIRQIFDTLGLDANLIKPNAQPPQLEAGQAQAQAGAAEPQARRGRPLVTAQKALTQATTKQN